MQKSKSTVAIDLDLTLFDTDVGWYNYLYKNSIDHDFAQYMSDKLSDNIEYNLRKYFTFESGFEGFDYWAKESTYQECDIHPYAKRVIQNLYEANIEIVFVSYCMGCTNQINNKIRRLKQEFDFMLPDDFNFVPAKKKNLVRCDLLIDDRHNFLNQMQDDVKLIKFDTPYVQEEPLKRKDVSVVSNWKQIENIICTMIEDGAL